MRPAVLIVGLVVGCVVLLQACTVFGLSAVGEGLGSEESAQRSGASAAGVLTGLLIMVGAGFVLPFPRFAAGVLVLAGLLGIAVGLTSDFSDQTIWGVVALVLGALAWFGARGKKRDDALKSEERSNLAAMAARAKEESSVPTRTCPNCAETIKAAALQCRFCGHRFDAANQRV